MNFAQKNNLRKLSFLGFKRNSTPGNDGGTSSANRDEDEVQLDEECAKIFAMDGSRLSASFNLQFPPTQNLSNRQYGEKDFTQHRKKSYPHTHVPLKIPPRSMRRRQSHTPSTPSTTLSPTSETHLESLQQQRSDTDIPTPKQSSPIKKEKYETNDEVEEADDAEDSTVLLSSMTLPEESEYDEEERSSESECILSDPCSYEKKVQFLGDDKKKKEKNPLKKPRKFSLPTEVNAEPNKKRHHHHHHHSHHHNHHHDNHRVSTQPEDLPLKGADRDQLDSHRSDDSKALRRPKISRPSNASMVHIGRKEGGELSPAFNKMYDHSPHAIFVELDELHISVDENEWKETARWIKYEEDVEEGVDRWGKPHVASLSFHSLLNLRKCLEDGLVLLDLEERDLPAIAYRVTEDLYKEDLIREEDKGKIMRTLLLRHRHVNEHHERGFRFSKKHSYASLQNLYELERRKISVQFDSHGNVKNGRLEAENKLLGDEPRHTVAVDIRRGRPSGAPAPPTAVTTSGGEEIYSASTEDVRKNRNDTILRRIPAGAQASSVLIGEVDFLEQPAISFIRLAEGIVIPSLIEVNIPCRFIFILMGPKRANLDYHEVGRSISTLMANQHFLEIAYGAFDRKALLSAINEFLDDSIVLPPGDWERKALLPIEELKAKSEQIRKRKETALLKAAEAQGIKEHLIGGILSDGVDKKSVYNPLERTRKPFGGLINDLRQRYPYFKSDIIDGLNAQCAAASIFMYFAALSGAVAFGGLLSSKTENSIGTSETLMCTCVAGVLFALLSGQPLVIVGTTGPLLLFDESLYQFCSISDINFLQTRFFIGFWLAFIGLFVACLEGSVFVKLFTRFTEDIFSALIVLLYILESVVKLIVNFRRHPLMTSYCEFEKVTISENFTESGAAPGTNAGMGEVFDLTNSSGGGVYDAIQYKPMEKFDEAGPINQPNTALFCTVLSLGTFIIAYYLKMFRNSQFLGRSARRALGDFGVPIAIVTMVFVDYMVPQTYTEKLSVPEGLSPSDTDRGWLILPAKIPISIMFASIIPAMLVYILLFMETHITELIIDKKERKLKKGSGFHLDIVLICLCNILSGMFGLPWVCAATVRSITHVSALTVMSRTHAPGEKPHLIEVKEQRISALTVSVLIGLSVLMAPLLRLVPMAVLFGVFLYMGAASIDGIQFFDRIKLFFMPVKHHPQASYVRKVKTYKMHIFTAVQLMCLIVLWVVKSTKAALAFPFFLLLMVPLRAQLTRFFSTGELRALDGDQPDVDDDELDFYAEAPLPG